jgi:hypothetical protein
MAALLASFAIKSHKESPSRWRQPINGQYYQ